MSFNNSFDALSRDLDTDTEIESGNEPESENIEGAYGEDGENNEDVNRLSIIAKYIITEIKTLCKIC